MKPEITNKINNTPLTNEQMREVAGGDYRTCFCGCCWAGNGGSSIQTNSVANWEHGYSSPCVAKAVTTGEID